MAEVEGSVHLLDWNGGMDWWTGLMSQQIMEKRIG